MTLVTIRNLGVTLSAPLFSKLNLVVNPGDRIGLVAANGRGKSTLLRCIAGLIDASEGEIARSRGLTLAYVEQDVPPGLMDSPFHGAVLAALSADRQAAESWRVDVALDTLDVPEPLRQRPLRQLSGGWQRFAMLARALVADADVLLLDEPTNHFDLARIRQLEDLINALPRDMPVVVSSHDRAFLDATTNRTLFLRPERSELFALPYSRARAALDEADAADARRYQRDLKTANQLRQQAAKLNNLGINSGSDLLLSKTKQLKQRAEKLEDAAKPAHLERSAGTIRLANRGTHAKVLVTLDDAAVEAPDGRLLFRTGKQFICKGDRIVLLGAERRRQNPVRRRCCARRSTIRRRRRAASGQRSRWCSAIATRRWPISPTPTRRHAPSRAASTSATSRRAQCSPAPACRSRCRADRSAACPADRRPGSACWCCG